MPLRTRSRCFCLSPVPSNILQAACIAPVLRASSPAPVFSSPYSSAPLIDDIRFYALACFPLYILSNKNYALFSRRFLSLNNLRASVSSLSLKLRAFMSFITRSSISFHTFCDILTLSSLFIFEEWVSVLQLDYLSQFRSVEDHFSPCSRSLTTDQPSVPSTERKDSSAPL